MQMDRKGAKPVEKTSFPSQIPLENSSPTFLSHIGHLPSYPQRCPSNTSSTTTSSSRSPLLSPHNQTTASSPSSPYPNVDVSSSRSPHQFPRHLPSNLKPLDHPISNRMPHDPWKKPTLFQKTSPVLLPRFSSNQSPPNHFYPSSAGLMFPEPSPPTGFPSSPDSSYPPRLSPNQSPSKQLPHPSQLPPNQWPTRNSLSDPGSPPPTAPSLTSKTCPINIPNPAQAPDKNTIRLSTQSNPAPPSPASNSTPSGRSNPQSTPGLGPPRGAPALPLGYGSPAGTNNENPHINTYAAQIGQYFKGRPILLVEFLLLLKRLNVGKIEANQFVERMSRLLDGRMDLLMELGAFVRPQHQHLIYAKVDSMAINQQSMNGGGDSVLPVYRSPTVDYLTKVCEEVDAETWKLLHIVLERYYSNLNDLLIQKEVVSQLEHVLKDYPDLQRKCGMLL